MNYVRDILKTKDGRIQTISPKATVPVLQLPSGKVLDQSIDIMMWALHQHDPHAWLACADEVQARQWVQRNDAVFKPLLDHYKYATRHPQFSRAEHRQRALDGFVLPLDAALSDYPALTVDAETEVRLRYGQAVELPDASPSASGHLRAYGPDGTLVALLRYDTATARWQPDKVFAAPL